MSLNNLIKKKYHQRGNLQSATQLADAALGPLYNDNMIGEFYVPSSGYLHAQKQPKLLESGWIVDAESPSKQKSNEFADPHRMAPNGDFDPSKFVDQNNPAIKYHHGTTTLGFKFKGGVIIAVDSRASMGSYIGSGTVKKIIEINKFLLGLSRCDKLKWIQSIHSMESVQGCWCTFHL